MLMTWMFLAFIECFYYCVCLYFGFMAVINSNSYDYPALNRRMYGYFGAYNMKSIVCLGIALRCIELLFTLAAIVVFSTE